MSNRWRCDSCGWIGPPTALQEARHPFRTHETIGGCPQCGEIDSELHELCDVADCARLATCGWPSPHGYRRTCHIHAEDAK